MKKNPKQPRTNQVAYLYENDGSTSGRFCANMIKALRLDVHKNDHSSVGFSKFEKVSSSSKQKKNPLSPYKERPTEEMSPCGAGRGG